MFKELTLQNIWESVVPVEKNRRFKFKSAVWGPTLVEGLMDHREAARTFEIFKNRNVDLFSSLSFSISMIFISYLDLEQSDFDKPFFQSIAKRNPLSDRSVRRLISKLLHFSTNLQRWGQLINRSPLCERRSHNRKNKFEFYFLFQ
jgi:hypothetical protein